MHGCCPGSPCEASWYTMNDAQGIPRWPAVPMEILFNVIAMIVFFVLRRRHKLAGQHFHLYLIAYGAFRFVHEFWRDTPRVAGVFSGYQIAALAVFALGVAGFIRRQKQSAGVTNENIEHRTSNAEL
jgi:phosphatidylglycerol:prolipoprotein diacylglycerol transferase